MQSRPVSAISGSKIDPTSALSKVLLFRNGVVLTRFINPHYFEPLLRVVYSRIPVAAIFELGI